MYEKLIRRSTYSYAVMLIVNPIIILCFQNCSVAKLTDVKASSQTAKLIELRRISIERPVK